MKAPPSQGTKPGEGTRTLCPEYRDGMLCTNGSRRCILGNDHRPCKLGASCKRRYTSCSFGHPSVSSSSSSSPSSVGVDRPSHSTHARSSGVSIRVGNSIRRTAPPQPPLSPLHLSPAPSPHPASHTMQSAGTPNSTTTTAPQPKPALLLIDGGHLRVFLDRLLSGHRSMTTRQMEDARVSAVETLVRVLSRTFHLSFVRKILHEGTHTGQPSRFHEQISHPDGAFIMPRIRGMKPKTARPYNLSTFGVEADKPPCTILVEKGVDVALCVDLTGDPLSHEEEYQSILVLSGDGDLEEALKVAARKRTVHVISMRGALAPSLNSFVKQMLRDISKVLESLADFLEATEAIPESEEYDYGLAHGHAFASQLSFFDLESHYGHASKVQDFPLLSDEDLASVPSAFLCPISLCVMLDPVVCDDGHSLDRASILQHIRARRKAFLPVTSPLTNMCMSSKLVTNHTLRKAIEEWVHTRLPQHEQQQQAPTIPTAIEEEAITVESLSIRSMAQERRGVVSTATVTNTDTATHIDRSGGSRGAEAARTGSSHTATHVHDTYTAALEPPHAYWGTHTRTSTHTHTRTHLDTYTHTHTPTHTVTTSPSSPIGIHLDDTQVCELFLWPLRALHTHLRSTSTTTTTVTTHVASLAPHTLLCVAALFVANLYFAGR